MENQIFVGNVQIDEMYLRLNSIDYGLTPSLFYQLLSEFPFSKVEYSSENESLTIIHLKKLSNYG